MSGHLPELEKSAKKLSKALASGDVDMLTFTTLRTAYFSQQARALTLEQALLEQGVALETLTGVLLTDEASGGRTSNIPAQLSDTQELHP